MSLFSITVGQRPRFAVPNFSGPQMREIAGVGIEANKARFAAGLDLNDSPAKPLSRKYAKAKQRARGSAIRDLRLTGRTLDALIVTEARQNVAVVGFDDSEAVKRALFNDAIDPMFGPSARDQQAIDTRARELFASNVRRSNEGR